MSNVFGDPAFLNSVLAMREQMEALRPQYESVARAMERLNLTALNDSVEQSLAAARDTHLAETARASTHLAEVARASTDLAQAARASTHLVETARASTDLAEAARASIGNFTANIEALKANIDSRYSIDLAAVRQSLMANYDIDLEAVQASLAAAYSIDLNAMRASFAAGLGVDLEAVRASLAAARDIDLAAMRGSLAGAHGIDLQAVKENLAGAHSIDFDGWTRPEERPDVAAGDADDLDRRASTAANAPPEARDPVDAGSSARAGHVRRAWDVLQVLLTVDNVLGNPGTTTLREAVSGAAQEVLLFLWLATIAQVPSPPPAPTVPVPEALGTPPHVTAGSLMDPERFPEREPVTIEHRHAMIDDDEEPDPHGSDDSR